MSNKHPKIYLPYPYSCSENQEILNEFDELYESTWFTLDELIDQLAPHNKREGKHNDY